MDENLKDIVSKTKSGDVRYRVYTVHRFLVSKRRKFWIKKEYCEAWVLGRKYYEKNDGWIGSSIPYSYNSAIQHTSVLKFKSLKDKENFIERNRNFYRFDFIEEIERKRLEQKKLEKQKNLSNRQIIKIIKEDLNLSGYFEKLYELFPNLKMYETASKGSKSRYLEFDFNDDNYRNLVVRVSDHFRKAYFNGIDFDDRLNEQYDLNLINFGVKNFDDLLINENYWFSKNKQPIRNSDQYDWFYETLDDVIEEKKNELENSKINKNVQVKNIERER